MTATPPGSRGRRQSDGTVPEPEAGEEELLAERRAPTSVTAASPKKDRKPRSKKKAEGDDDTSSSDDDSWGIRLWDELEQDLPEVLPSEIIGWLMLRRSSLTPQQRLNVLSATGNSLKAEDIEPGLRGAEDELRLQEGHGGSKGHGKKGRSTTFWVEQGGEWGLLAMEDSEQEELLDSVHWMGALQSVSEV